MFRGHVHPDALIVGKSCTYAHKSRDFVIHKSCVHHRKFSYCSRSMAPEPCVQAGIEQRVVRTTVHARGEFEHVFGAHESALDSVSGIR
jgi:hypothetical protein